MPKTTTPADKGRFLLTTPIYYVNDVPHIGSAYTTLVADALARAHRQLGGKTRFITGTDEHGVKVARQAAAAGQSNQDYVDSISQKFHAAWSSLHIEPDAFVRTTDPRHQYLVGQVMSRLRDNQFIYPGSYRGWYCVGCEEYKEEFKDIATLKSSASAPSCDIHQRPLELLEEQIYYFALSQFQDRIIELIKSQEFRIEPPARRNEVLAFLTSQPLRDLPVTRSQVAWGITVPFDPNQTVYVWIDALLNYLSFANPDGDLAKIDQPDSWWPADFQLIGKDIWRFHAIIWPALLIALNIPLPKELFIHGFFTVNGTKMSKSLGNVISPQQLIDRYGAEAARYLIVSAVPLGNDGDISLAKFDAAYTATLANGLGNLVQRTISLINKFAIKPQVAANRLGLIEEAYLANDLSRAIDLTVNLINDSNSYLAAEQPWAMTNDAERQNVLTKTYAQLLTIAEAVTPLMPVTGQRIKEQLDTLRPEPLFPRLDSVAYNELNRHPGESQQA